MHENAHRYDHNHSNDGDGDGTETSPPQRSHILIVDDEESLREMLARFLTRIGYHVLIAGDGIEALELCRQHARTIRMVLLDMTMPRMGGENCATLLRQEHPNISIVMMSAYADHATLERCQSLRDAYLAKPFQLDQLRQLVQQLVPKK
jgi:CheY-like chemotaxis protein